MHAHLPSGSLRSAFAKSDAPAGGPAGGAAWSPASAIDFMDRHGIATQLLSLPHMFVPADGQEPREAAATARRVNEAFAAIIGAHPDRFGAFACIPAGDPETALEEMAYALDVLHLDGAGLTSNSAGRYLGDPFFEPLLEELSLRGTPAFIHPTSPIPGQMTSQGRPSWTIEYPIDTARNIVSAIYSGVFERHTQLRIILPHCGGALPSLAWRIASLVAIGRGPADADISTSNVRDALHNLYYDTALSGDALTIDPLLALTSPGHLLFGTDSGAAPEDVISANTTGLDSIGFTPKELGGVLGGNAARLFPRMARS